MKNLANIGRTNRLDNASAISVIFPIPSPPPINITVRASFCKPNFSRKYPLDPAGMLKDGRIGRPWHTICDALSPKLSACETTIFVATKHFNTLYVQSNDR
jgi:hypothetical protein